MRTKMLLILLLASILIIGGCNLYPKETLTKEPIREVNKTYYWVEATCNELRGGWINPPPFRDCSGYGNLGTQNLEDLCILQFRTMIIEIMQLKGCEEK